MKNRSAAIIVGLLVGILMVLPANVGAASPVFTFPVSYAAPSVPPSFGAQGGQGPTGSIGPRGTPGTFGHLGPTNITTPMTLFPAVRNVVTFRILNGTSGVNSPAVSQKVTATNATTGIVATGFTNGAGFVNLTLTVGFYYLHAFSSAASHIDWTQAIELTTGLQLTRYLMPSTMGTVNVNNGGVKGNVYAYADAPWGGQGPAFITQMTAQLVNVSGGSTVIATAYSLTNGSAVFVNVSKSYTYDVTHEGYVNTQTGVKYYMDNRTYAGTFTFGSQLNVAVTSNSLSGWCSTNAVVTGTAIPTGGSSFTWSIGANTVVSGGTTVISVVVSTSANVKVIFQNGLLIWNTSSMVNGIGTGTSWIFRNETVIFHSDAQATFGFALTNMNSYNSVVFGHSWPVTVDMGFVEASHTSFAYLNLSLATYGNFSDDAVLSSPNLYLGDLGGTTNLPTTFRNCSFLNSTVTSAQANAVHWRGELDGSLVVNSTVKMFYWPTYVNDSSLSIIPSVSVPAIALGGFGKGYAPDTTTMTGTHDRIVFTSATNTTYTAFSSLKAGRIFEMGGNLTFSNVTLLAPVNNVTLVGDPHLFSDVLDENVYSIASLKTDVPLKNPQDGWLILSFRNAWMNFSTILFGASTEATAYSGNWTLTHDVFGQFIAGNAFNFFSLTQPNNGLTTVKLTTTFANDTFGTVFFDPALYATYQTVEFGGVGMWWMSTGQNPSTSFGGRAFYNFLNVVKVVYSTFTTRMVGGGSNGESAEVALLANFVSATIDHDVFLNLPYLTASGPAASFYDPIWASDVSVGGGVVTTTNDIFEDLDNQTQSISPSFFHQRLGNSPKLLLSNDQFYYSPQASTFENPHGPLANTTNTATPTDPALGSSHFPLVSTMGYGIGLMTNATFNNSGGGATNGAMLVSNFSLHQTIPGVTTGWTFGVTTAFLWSWSVAPDVNTSTGVAVVSYANGLVAGPQPNFKWQGFNYSEQVEPTAVQVSVNSTSAPAITVKFDVTEGLNYTLTEYDSVTGVALDSTVFVGNSTRFYSTTFSPASDHLNTTFVVASTPTALVGGAPLNTVLIWEIVGAFFGLTALAVAVGAWNDKRR